MKWMKLGGSVAFFLICGSSIGCVNTRGSLTVRRDFSVRNIKLEKINIPIGMYGADLRVHRDTIGRPKTLVAKIRFPQSEAQKIQIPIPPNIVIPEENGPFRISGRDIGQDFDLVGEVKTIPGETSQQYRFRRECLLNDTELGLEEVTAHRQRMITTATLQFESSENINLAQLHFVLKAIEDPIQDSVSECRPYYYYERTGYWGNGHWRW